MPLLARSSPDPHFEQFSKSATNRDRQRISGGRFPVISDDHVTDQVPSVIKIIIHERFKEELINVLARVVTGKGPQLSHKTP